MNFENDLKLQDRIKKLLKDPPQHKFSDAKKRELIGRLYEVKEEKKNLVYFEPFKFAPVYASVLATALIIFGYAHFFSPLYPVVSGTKGALEVYRSGEERWITVQKPKLRLRENDIVKTSGESVADIVIPNLYHVRLKGNSEIRLAKAGPRISAESIKYDLIRGKAFVYYKKGKSRRKKFEINTPEAGISVVGTEFMVKTMRGAQSTWVGVLDGVVRVTGRDIKGPLAKPKLKTVRVKAGEKATVRKGKAPARPKRLLEKELLELEELYRIGEKPQVALLISTGRNRVRELLSFTPLYISAEMSGILPEKIEKIAKIFNKAVKEGSKAKHIESIKEFERLVKYHPNPKYDVQFLLFIGAYYEYLDEHLEAIDAFQRIIVKYPKSNLRSLAQCAIGLIYEEKLNAPSNARISYKKILSEYPQSPETTEAKRALVRLAGNR
ncbi:MAG: FecR domain-containing protein [Omnitrophica bacterium]|nr:FecR domain-containing protein [Candidatus Omnitrophota bacterium]